MPTYRYRCGTCGEEFELWQSITDSSITTHEDCGGQLVKVLSAAGIVLKGSGFYRNDSRSNGEQGDGSRKDKQDADSGKRDADSGKKQSDSGTKEKETTSSPAGSSSSTSKSDRGSSPNGASDSSKSGSGSSAPSSGPGSKT